MSVDLSPIGGAGAQFFDNNGVPLSGGKLYTYDAGTTTPKASYTSGSGLVPHTNPIILDSAGRVPGGEIWLTSGEDYKFVLETPTSILLGTWDNIYGYTSGSADASTEVQTATAGQTLFVLNSMAYTPGTNTLGVYIDGVNQVVNNSYIETNATSVTFVTGLHAGAVVKFINLNIASTDANVVAYAPGFTGSTLTTVQEKLQQYVSVKDFGAVGDGVADDTLSVQAAIDYAQTDGQALYAPAGVYAVSGLTYDGDLPLRLFGDGQSQQSGGSLVETATVFKLTQASARLFDCVSGGNTAVKQFEMFSVLNASGGSSETAFYSENGTFTLFKNITGEGFQYGIRHQKTVYSHLHYVHFRNCDYAFDYTNITSTPPFVLNDLGANGFYNNVIVFDNCVANTGVIGFKVAGATVTFTVCDATGQSTAGWRIGGSDYNLTVVSLDQAYGENISANVMEITNANVTIGALFIGSNCAKAIVANNSRITVSSLRSYAVVTLGVEATNSYVNVDNYGGTFTTKWSQSGTGQVRFIEDEETNLTSFSINQSQSVTVTCESSTTRIVAVDLLGFENGTTYFGLRIFLRGGNVYVTGNTPSDLDVTSVINGNGNYDLVLTNSAGFAYNFSGYAKPQFIDYTTPIPPGV